MSLIKKYGVFISNTKSIVIIAGTTILLVASLFPLYPSDIRLAAQSPSPIHLKEDPFLVYHPEYKPWDDAMIIDYIDEESTVSYYIESTSPNDNHRHFCIHVTQPVTGKQCRTYELVEINDPFVKYYESSLSQTIDRYIEVNQIPSDQIGLSFYDSATSHAIAINTQTLFVAASTIKFPLAVILYEYAAKGNIQLEDTILYEAKHDVDSTAIISTQYAIGDDIPISSLLKYMLFDSDNNATQMLFEQLTRFGRWQTIMTSFFGVAEDSIRISGNMVTADYLMATIQHVLQNPQTYEEFSQYLMAAMPHRYLKKHLPSIPILHKYGSYAGHIHDMGLVFGEHPYAIVILTTQLSNAEEHIGRINALIHSYLSFQDEMHQRQERQWKPKIHCKSLYQETNDQMYIK